MIPWTLLAVGALLCSVVSQAMAQATLQTGTIRIQLESFFDEPNNNTFQQLTDLQFDGLGNTFVVDRDGDIRTLNNSVVGSTPVLDLTSETLATAGAGSAFFSLTFHPDYNTPGTNGYRKAYTYHTIADDGNGVDFNEGTQPTGQQFNQLNVLTEWEFDSTGLQVDLSSRRELFRAGHPNANLHAGGNIVFDNDNNLIVGLGTPNPGVGQNTQSLIGAVVRIDPIDPSLTPSSSDAIGANGAYRIPSDNPFVGNSAALDEIYAFGLRNPFRISFDPVTETLFAGDVGQGQREEINVIEPGGNFGWPNFEGTLSFANNPQNNQVGPLVDPFLEYSRAVGRSVIGGFVYRGDDIPELQGKYVFGDLIRSAGPFFSEPGRLFYIDPFDENGVLRDPSEIELNEFLIDGGDGTPELGPVSFTVGTDGEIYIVGNTSGGTSAIRKLVASDVITGDLNRDNAVNAADFTVFRDSFGQQQVGDLLKADADNSGLVDIEDFSRFIGSFGDQASTTSAGLAIPEPTTAALVLASLLGWPRRFGLSCR